MYVGFIDLEKAYNRVTRGVLWQASVRVKGVRVTVSEWGVSCPLGFPMWMK